jgi:hypothetical protein
MDDIRSFLSPLTDWMPPELRGLLDVEVWWLIELTVALLLLLVLGLLARAVWRAVFGRREQQEEWDRNLRVQLDECPLPVRAPGLRWLYIYHLPVRLRLVVLAPPGKDAEVDALAVERLLDGVLPGLGGIAANDRPKIRVWPTQLSRKGFTAVFHRCTVKTEPEGQPSRWVLVAGRAMLGRQPVLLGLGLWAGEPNTIGRLTLEPHQWLDVLRLRTPEG